MPCLSPRSALPPPPEPMYHTPHSPHRAARQPPQRLPSGGRGNGGSGWAGTPSQCGTLRRRLSRPWTSECGWGGGRDSRTVHSHSFHDAISELGLGWGGLGLRPQLLGAGVCWKDRVGQAAPPTPSVVNPSHLQPKHQTRNVGDSSNTCLTPLTHASQVGGGGRMRAGRPSAAAGGGRGVAAAGPVAEGGGLSGGAAAAAQREWWG